MAATITASQVYALRSCAKLPLPLLVQENIAKLRIKPVTYKPFHKPQAPRQFRPKPQHQPSDADNWREKALVEMVRRVREREDPEYSEIFAIFNKITTTTLDKLCGDAITYTQKRDASFRLRVATLLFDRAITQPTYSALMAECALRISATIQDMKDDIQAQIAMFPKLYNMNDTLTFPQSSDPDFDAKVIECMKQKEKRRGYAKFTMELCLRGLVSDECVREGLNDVVREISDTAKQPKSPQTEENVTQFAVFLFETAKLSAQRPEVKTFLKDAIGGVLQTDRTTMPSLNMKSRFKLEDAFKLVQ